MSSVNSNMYSLTPTELGVAVQRKHRQDARNTASILPSALVGAGAGIAANKALQNINPETGKLIKKIAKDAPALQELMKPVAEQATKIFTPNTMKNMVKHPKKTAVAAGTAVTLGLLGAGKVLGTALYKIFGTAAEAKRIRDNRKFDTKV